MMSDDIYYSEEIPVIRTAQLSSETGQVRPSESYECNLLPKRSRDCRLHEIEEQIEKAESRCNTLKGQVNYMKMLYNGLNKEGGDANNNVEEVPTSSNIPASSNIPTGSNNPTSSSTKPKPRNPSVEPQQQAKRKRSDKSQKRNKPKDKPNPMSNNDGHWKEEPSRDTEKMVGRMEVPQRSTVVHNDDVANAERSLHNIITGITHSVNKLSQWNVQFEPTPAPVQNVRSRITEIAVPSMQEGVQNIQCAPKNIRNTKPEKPYQLNPNNDLSFTTEQYVNEIKSTILKSNVQKRTKSNTRPGKNSGVSISELKKRIKGAPLIKDKKGRLGTNLPTRTEIAPSKRSVVPKSKDLNVTRTYTVIADKNKHINQNEGHSEKLIELYHNSAIKMVTPSEDSIAMNKRIQEHRLQYKPGTAVCSRIPEESVMKQSFPTPQTILPAYPIPEYHGNNQSLAVAPKSMALDGMSGYSKNYELPTIASKMKQVAKSYFQNFTFKTIPFVAATSTSPSHNLGINIQQVLSIMKGRKPVTGISPTLAYNIELAANKLGSRPFTALMSNLGSRLTSRCICPAGPRRMNIAQLAEMAKEIPEDTFDSQASNMDIVNRDYESGDKISRQHNWIVDPKLKSEKCVCSDKPGVNFDDVCSRYMKPTTQGYGDSAGVPTTAAQRQSRKMKKPWNYSICKTNNRPDTNRILFGRNKTAKNFPSVQQCGDGETALDSPKPPPLKLKLNSANSISSREKNLKDILKNLHAEFATINDRYEDLKNNAANVNAQDADEQLREVEKLEKDLLNKEDEITMVMTLYKEVVALKQQIRVLKKQASQMSVTVTPYTKYKDYKDQNAAGHLTKLLRHIQQFQESLKNK